MQGKSTILKIEPPLPCFVWTSDTTQCGKPATTAYADYNGLSWILTPICEECTRATAKMYGVRVKADEDHTGACDE